MLKSAPALCGLVSLALAALLAGGQSLPESPGKDLVEAVCTECHTTERIVAKHMSREDWQAKVLEMLQEDPDVTQPERDRIVDYLAKTFPAKINVNKAAAMDLAAALEISAKDAEAIVRYREQNGVFKTLDDLRKVPGIDAAKIDSHKDRLEF